MNSVFVIENGTVTALAGGPLSLADLGPRTTKRVSRIEFVPEDNWWRVYDADTNEELANFADYDAALAWEREWYNHQLLTLGRTV